MVLDLHDDLVWLNLETNQQWWRRIFPLPHALMITHIFCSLYIFVETPAFEHQNRLFIVIPDLIRYPEFTYKSVNPGCRIKSGMTVKSFSVPQQTAATLR